MLNTIPEPTISRRRMPGRDVQNAYLIKIMQWCVRKSIGPSIGGAVAFRTFRLAWGAKASQHYDDLAIEQRRCS